MSAPATAGAAPGRRVRVVLELLLGVSGIALLGWAWRADAAWFEIHGMRNYCAVDASDLARATAWRWIAGVAGLVLVVPLRRWMGRWADRQKPRDSVARLASVVGAVVAALVACDVVLRTFKLRTPAPTVTIQLPAQLPHAQRWWTLEPSHTTVIVDDGRPIAYSTNAKGDRARDEDDLPDPHRPTILFGGESITVGLGVTWDETYPARVGEKLGVQVVNCAVHGYGDDQVYLRVRERIAELEHPIALVTMTLADALDRDVADWRDRLQPDGRGGFFVVKATPEAWRTSPARALFEAVAPFHGDEAIRNARAFMRATAEEGRARGARPLVVWTNYQKPCLPDDRGAPRVEHLLFDDLGVDHVHVDLDPNAIIRSNGHPDPSAHEVIAQAVAHALIAAGVVAAAGGH